MRPRHIVPFRYLFILLLLLPGACNKVIDWKDVWDKQKPNCRIEKIISYSNWYGTRTGIFNYNQKGNPVSITFDYTSTGASNFLFLYDNRDRIKGYLATYPNNDYEFWFSYTYDAKGQVISDTMYIYGIIENGLPKINPHSSKYYGNYEYDAYGRVVKVVRYEVGRDSPYNTEEYFYNSDGNLTLFRQSGQFSGYEVRYDSYDNRVNYHQTNKVWMFVDRDYSKNNPVSAVQYNSKGLPVKFDIDQSIWFDFLWQIDLRRADIIYSCGK